MNLQTILNILYANELDAVISLAVKIENNIAEDESILSVGDHIVVEIYNENIKDVNLKFSGDKRYGYFPVRVQAYNKYKLDKPYLVKLPNGQLKWVNNSDNKPDMVESINPDITAISVREKIK